jgi:hypothetical protein
MFLLFWLPFAANVFAQSPAHGSWAEAELYTAWEKAGKPIFERDQGTLFESTFDGKTYVIFNHNPLITDTHLRAGDSGLWRIISFEENGNRVIYSLTSVDVENSGGTITVVMTGEDTMYFESYDGDDNFIAEVRFSSLRFGEAFLHYRVRVEK